MSSNQIPLTPSQTLYIILFRMKSQYAQSKEKQSIEKLYIIKYTDNEINFHLFYLLEKVQYSEKYNNKAVDVFQNPNILICRRSLDVDLSCETCNNKIKRQLVIIHSTPAQRNFIFLIGSGYFCKPKYIDIEEGFCMSCNQSYKACAGSGISVFPVLQAVQELSQCSGLKS
ncbi:hypothetical protein pb186bvf_004756 [Paramecium bursaria]